MNVHCIRSKGGLACLRHDRFNFCQKN
jgi:hypothetical protein